MSKTIHLKVIGMTCGHCVMHVKKALEAVEKVETVDVNLEKGSAEMTVSDDFENTDSLIGAVENAGYSASL